jgi:hypothetical protein
VLSLLLQIGPVQIEPVTPRLLSVRGGTDQPAVLTSPIAPGVTHKFTNLYALNDEVSEARIAAGFRWRFSTQVGKNMGWKLVLTPWNMPCSR